jgi:hypothetical protein
MTKVKLQFREKQFNEKLHEISSRVSALQRVYNLLLSLGCEGLTVRDLVNILESDGHSIEQIRALVFRGKEKALQIAPGLRIDPSSFQMDAMTIREIATIARNTPSGVDASNYTIVNDSVQCIDCLSEKFTERFTDYGSQGAKDFIDEVQVLCERINSLRSDIGATHVHHPLSPVESWMRWTGEKYEPNVYHIGQHIKI